jgi:hypothetical protein
MHTRWESAAPEAPSVYANVLRNTRVQISESNLEEENWYRKMDNEAREQYRLSGRSLVQGLIGHLTSSDEGLEAEAKSLGYEHAFQFFRTSVMDAILAAYENADVRSPQIWSDLFRKMNSFSDLIIITLLDTYESFQHGGR